MFTRCRWNSGSVVGRGRGKVRRLPHAQREPKRRRRATTTTTDQQQQQQQQPQKLQQEQQEYDCYMYWTEYEQWKVFITQRRDEATGQMINVPIWSGRVFTPYPMHHRFHSHWVNFRAGAAPVSAYNVTGNTTNCQYAHQSNTLRRAAHDVHH